MSKQGVTAENKADSKPKLLPHGDLLPFVLLSSCFAWWGIANNMTDPLVRAFTGIFSDLSNFQSSLIQFAFYGAYFGLAIPGSIIARKFGYKKGVLIGLGMYVVGCFLFYPASLMLQFVPFLIAFYVLAGGLSILETNANPYVLALGPEETATQRLNLAQSFNPVGSVIGTLLCQILILAKLEALKEKTADAAAEQVQALQSQQLSIVIVPYLIIGGILVAIWLLIAFTKMPFVKESDTNVHFVPTIKRLMKNPNYVFAVIAQFFYVGAQISVWTYTVYYIPEQLGISPSEALKYYHTPALIIFGISRFVATALMTKVQPHNLLKVMAILGAVFTAVVILAGGQIGAIALVGISACMSLMFPTIFGLGSRGLGEDTKIGGSGLIMAILGGALLTPLQGWMIDVSNVSVSYVIPLICFVVIAVYAVFAGKVRLPDRSVETVIPQ
jgi:FHS family L-fucose permease-like MFS transporter